MDLDRAGGAHDEERVTEGHELGLEPLRLDLRALDEERRAVRAFARQPPLRGRRGRRGRREGAWPPRPAPPRARRGPARPSGSSPPPVPAPPRSPRRWRREERPRAPPD